MARTGPAELASIPRSPMPTPNSQPTSNPRTKLFLYEGTKVLVIFLAFYFLQGQIFRVRHDIQGSTQGLVHAQETTSSELDDTQQFLELTMEDVEKSHSALSETKRSLEKSLSALRQERERLLGLIEGQTAELEEKFASRLGRGWEAFDAVKVVAEENATRLETLASTIEKSPRDMKQRMLFPTVQLRGNGTVGSGVIIYSELQPDFTERAIATTFILTAYHVVSEVMSQRVEGLLEEVHVISERGSEKTEALTARLVLFDKSRDIALLRLDTQKRMPYLAKLMSNSHLGSVDVFSPAYAVGCPLGNRPLPTLGEVSSKQKTVGEQTFWMLNAPTFFGNSGGGIYSIPGCELIGVSSMIYTYGKSHPTVVPHMGLFVPLSEIYSWLDGEGYSFVHEREPIPGRLRWKLAWLDGETSAAVPASASD